MKLPELDDVVDAAVGHEWSPFLAHRDEAVVQMCNHIITTELQGPAFHGSSSKGNAKIGRALNQLDPEAIWTAGQWTNLNFTEVLQPLSTKEASQEEIDRLAIMRDAVLQCGRNIDELNEESLRRMFEVIKSKAGKVKSKTKEVNLQCRYFQLLQIVRSAIARLGIMENEPLIAIPEELEDDETGKRNEWMRLRHQTTRMYPCFVDAIIDKLKMKNEFPSVAMNSLYQAVTDQLFATFGAAKFSQVPVVVVSSDSSTGSSRQARNTRAYNQATTYNRERKFPGRNEDCHCGSERKYKKCCMRRDRFDQN